MSQVGGYRWPQKPAALFLLGLCWLWSHSPIEANNVMPQPATLGTSTASPFALAAEAAANAAIGRLGQHLTDIAIQTTSRTAATMSNPTTSTTNVHKQHKHPTSKLKISVTDKLHKFDLFIDPVCEQVHKLTERQLGRVLLQLKQFSTHTGHSLAGCFQEHGFPFDANGLHHVMSRQHLSSLCSARLSQSESYKMFAACAARAWHAQIDRELDTILKERIAGPSTAAHASSGHAAVHLKQQSEQLTSAERSLIDDIVAHLHEEQVQEIASELAQEQQHLADAKVVAAHLTTSTSTTPKPLQVVHQTLGKLDQPLMSSTSATDLSSASASTSASAPATVIVISSDGLTSMTAAPMPPASHHAYTDILPAAKTLVVAGDHELVTTTTAAPKGEHNTNNKTELVTLSDEQMKTKTTPVAPIINGHHFINNHTESRGANLPQSDPVLLPVETTLSNSTTSATQHHLQAENSLMMDMTQPTQHPAVSYQELATAPAQIPTRPSILFDQKQHHQQQVLGSVEPLGDVVVSTHTNHYAGSAVTNSMLSTGQQAAAVDSIISMVAGQEPHNKVASGATVLISPNSVPPLAHPSAAPVAQLAQLQPAAIQVVEPVVQTVHLQITPATAQPATGAHASSVILTKHSEPGHQSSELAVEHQSASLVGQSDHHLTKVEQSPTTEAPHDSKLDNMVKLLPSPVAGASFTTPTPFLAPEQVAGGGPTVSPLANFLLGSIEYAHKTTTLSPPPPPPAALSTPTAPSELGATSTHSNLSKTALGANTAQYHPPSSAIGATSSPEHLLVPGAMLSIPPVSATVSASPVPTQPPPPTTVAPPPAVLPPPIAPAVLTVTQAPSPMILPPLPTLVPPLTVQHQASLSPSPITPIMALPPVPHPPGMSAVPPLPTPPPVPLAPFMPPASIKPANLMPHLEGAVMANINVALDVMKSSKSVVKTMTTTTTQKPLATKTIVDGQQLKVKIVAPVVVQEQEAETSTTRKPTVIKLMATSTSTATTTTTPKPKPVTGKSTIKLISASTTSTNTTTTTTTARPLVSIKIRTKAVDRKEEEAGKGVKKVGQKHLALGDKEEELVKLREKFGAANVHDVIVVGEHQDGDDLIFDYDDHGEHHAEHHHQHEATGHTHDSHHSMEEEGEEDEDKEDAISKKMVLVHGKKVTATSGGPQKHLLRGAKLKLQRLRANEEADGHEEHAHLLRGLSAGDVVHVDAGTESE